MIKKLFQQWLDENKRMYRHITYDLGTMQDYTEWLDEHPYIIRLQQTEKALIKIASMGVVFDARGIWSKEVNRIANEALAGRD